MEIGAERLIRRSAPGVESAAGMNDDSGRAFVTLRVAVRSSWPAVAALGAEDLAVG